MLSPDPISGTVSLLISESAFAQMLVSMQTVHGRVSTHRPVPAQIAHHPMLGNLEPGTKLKVQVVRLRVRRASRRLGPLRHVVDPQPLPGGGGAEWKYPLLRTTLGGEYV